MGFLLSPSILSADFGNLDREIEMLNQSEADMFHVDVMDGVFVPNISFGFPVMEVLKRKAVKPLDVHLMIVEPERYIERFAEAGADIITVHYEVCTHLDRTIQQIKQAGAKAGVALNPATNVDLLKNVITELDLVLVMSVNPGFGGQNFITNTYRKLIDLQGICNQLGYAPVVEVDGGVNDENIPHLLEAGANAFVAGNAIFKSESARGMISRMKTLNATGGAVSHV